MSSIRNLCSTPRGAEAGRSIGSEGCERNLDNLIYRFDADIPWSYFDGAPIASSVERGRKKNNAKLKKIYFRKRRKTNTRKNRPHKQIETMSLLCSCKKGCLLRRNAHGECSAFIQNLRQDFYGKSYNEQNYILSRQMDVRVCASGLLRVTYKVPSLGAVCRGAFMKMQNKGSVISVNEELRDVLSFRKARKDTCHYCDEVLNKTDNSLSVPNCRATCNTRS